MEKIKLLIVSVLFLGLLPGQSGSRDVGDLIRFLKSQYESTFGFHAEITEWSQLGEGDALIGAQFASLRHRLGGEGSGPSHVYDGAWSNGKLIGRCLDRLHASLPRDIYLYYDGQNSVLLDRLEDVVTVKTSAFSSGAVLTWPHYLLAIDGGVPLVATMQAAAAAGELEVVGVGGETVVTFPHRSVVVRLHFASEPTSLTGIDYLAKSHTGRLGVSMSYVLRCDESGRAVGAQVTLFARDDGSPTGFSAEAGVSYVLRVDRVDVVGEDVSSILSRAKKCGRVSVGDESYLLPDGIESAIGRDALSLSGYHGVIDCGVTKAGLLAPLNPGESSAQRVKALEWGPVLPESPHWIESRTPQASLERKWCGQMSLVMQGRLTGNALSYTELLALAPEPVVSLSRVVELSIAMGNPLEALVVPVSQIASVKVPFILAHAAPQDGGVGHLTTCVPREGDLVPLEWDGLGSARPLRTVGMPSAVTVLVGSGDAGSLREMMPGTSVEVLLLVPMLLVALVASAWYFRRRSAEGRP